MELIIKILQYSSNEGDLVADFFLGGFNTAKAAVALNRRITGFEINRRAFDFHIQEMSFVKPGYLLESVRSGDGSPPVNQRKRWTMEERDCLKKRFKEVYPTLKNKRQTIKILEQEFDRGYFAIRRQLRLSFFALSSLNLPDREDADVVKIHHFFCLNPICS